jgi:hypothetical protein
VIQFRTRAKNYNQTPPLNHQFNPTDNEYGGLGSGLKHFKEFHSRFMTFYVGDPAVSGPEGALWGYKNTATHVDDNPVVHLNKELLEFGPGGDGSGNVPDTRLKRISPGFFELYNTFGPYADAPAIVSFRTKDKAGSGIVDHQFAPTDDKHGLLGSETKEWKEVHSVSFFFLDTGYVRCQLPGENALIQLTKELLEFGPGGATAPDVYLKRTGANSFELKAALLQPAGDNVLELGASAKRFKKIYVSALGCDLLPTTSDALDLGSSALKWRDLYLSGAVRALAGGFAVHLLPNATGTYDLGSDAKKWSSLYVAGLGKVGWLNVANYIVITDSRVLQNVTANVAIITSGQFPLTRMPRGDAGQYIRGYGAGFDPMYAAIPVDDLPGLPASKITSGRFGLARLPEGAAGYVLEAEGGGFDPMYVNPNGRYAPASHNHAGEVLTPDTIYANHLTSYIDLFVPTITTGAVACNTMSIATSCNRQYTHPSSQQCVYASSVAWEVCPHFDFLDDLGIIKGLRTKGKDKNGVPLIDPATLPPEVMQNGLIDAKSLVGLLIGAVKQLAVEVDYLKKQNKGG